MASDTAARPLSLHRVWMAYIWYWSAALCVLARHGFNGGRDRGHIAVVFVIVAALNALAYATGPYKEAQRWPIP